MATTTVTTARPNTLDFSSPSPSESGDSPKSQRFRPALIRLLDRIRGAQRRSVGNRIPSHTPVEQHRRPLGRTRERDTSRDTARAGGTTSRGVATELHEHRPSHRDRRGARGNSRCAPPDPGGGVPRLCARGRDHGLPLGHVRRRSTPPRRAPAQFDAVDIELPVRAHRGRDGAARRRRTDRRVLLQHELGATRAQRAGRDSSGGNRRLCPRLYAACTIPPTSSSARSSAWRASRSPHWLCVPYAIGHLRRSL